MRIAIFGGSFNPVHNEHINLAAAARRALGLDKIIVVPSHVTPLKNGRLTVPPADRFNMCKLAFDGAEVSDYEIAAGGVSYSYLTCREFKKRYPDDKLYFVMGADMYESFGDWKNPRDILDNVTLAVCAREKPLALNVRFPAVSIGYTGAKVSSTRIRALAALGEDTGEDVPAIVADYIRGHNLYRLNGVEEVKKLLTKSRWEHTVRVAITAAENCARAGVSERAALTAALFHDCTKYLTLNSPLLKGFVCPDGVLGDVVHQYSGAYVAEKIFGIDDEDILNAIRYHSSGRENMSALEKLIYLSDMLEEGRTFGGVEELRGEFARGLDAGLIAAFGHQIEYLGKSGKEIYPLTEKAYKYLKEHRNEQ